MAENEKKLGVSKAMKILKKIKSLFLWFIQGRLPEEKFLDDLNDFLKHR